jgi:hypothetical protein
MSPLNLIPSGKIFLLPPNNRQAIAFLISSSGKSGVRIANVSIEEEIRLHQGFQRFQEQ